MKTRRLVRKGKKSFRNQKGRKSVRKTTRKKGKSIKRSKKMRGGGDDIEDKMRLLEKDKSFNCDSLEIKNTKQEIRDYYSGNEIDDVKINNLLARSRLCSIRKEANSHDLQMAKDYEEDLKKKIEEWKIEKGFIEPPIK